MKLLIIAQRPALREAQPSACTLTFLAGSCPVRCRWAFGAPAPVGSAADGRSEHRQYSPWPGAAGGCSLHSQRKTEKAAHGHCREVPAQAYLKDKAETNCTERLEPQRSPGVR